MGEQESEFKMAIDQFCKQAGITKGQFAEIMGLSHIARLSEVYKGRQNYHLRHFEKIQELQRISQKTGEDFINYMSSLQID